MESLPGLRRAMIAGPSPFRCRRRTVLTFFVRKRSVMKRKPSKTRHPRCPRALAWEQLEERRLLHAGLLQLPAPVAPVAEAVPAFLAPVNAAAHAPHGHAAVKAAARLTVGLDSATAPETSLSTGVGLAVDAGAKLDATARVNLGGDSPLTEGANVSAGADVELAVGGDSPAGLDLGASVNSGSGDSGPGVRLGVNLGGGSTLVIPILGVGSPVGDIRLPFTGGVGNPGRFAALLNNPPNSPQTLEPPAGAQAVAGSRPSFLLEGGSLEALAADETVPPSDAVTPPPAAPKESTPDHPDLIFAAVMDEQPGDGISEAVPAPLEGGAVIYTAEELPAAQAPSLEQPGAAEADLVAPAASAALADLDQALRQLLEQLYQVVLLGSVGPWHLLPWVVALGVVAAAGEYYRRRLRARLAPAGLPGHPGPWLMGPPPPDEETADGS